MGDNIKGLHNCPRVPFSYDCFFDAQGDLVNQISNIVTMMREVTKMVACPTFVGHTLDENSYRLILLLSKSLLNSGHPCDSHVTYDLFYSSGVNHECI